MFNLTNEHIDFILADIQKDGVRTEDLQYELLDHICCIIENEIDATTDFYSFYGEIRSRFCKTNLGEIQEERDKLITFKNYYVMKNTLKIAGLSSAFLTISGAILKTYHLPGAGIAILSGGLVFSLLFLPLMIALKFKDEAKQVDKWVFSIGFFIAIVMTIGVLFKIMHWPYATILMSSSLSIFIFGYVPLYYLSRIRRAEEKFNTTINSVLMFAAGSYIFVLIKLGVCL